MKCYVSFVGVMVTLPLPLLGKATSLLCDVLLDGAELFT
jgi:hypothetical protein